MEEQQLDWQLSLAECLAVGDTDSNDKVGFWQTAIGLQAVKEIAVSDFLLETARAHIGGTLDIDGVQKRLQEYYSGNTEFAADFATREADVTSARIVQVLSEDAPGISPLEWQTIHRRLFAGVFDCAGQIRDTDASRDEWILQGETANYASSQSVRRLLSYDFEMEKQFSYAGRSAAATNRHIAKFAADIWQIHPFDEGNTRSLAVMLIRYLRGLGFQIHLNAFAKHSVFFRNALVRANYVDLPNGIQATTKYLEQFFDMFLFSADHALNNSELRVAYNADEKI